MLLPGMTAGAQVPNSNKNGQPSDNAPVETAAPARSAEAPTTPTVKPGVTVTGKPPRAELPLPALPPDEFNDCITRATASLTLGPIQGPILVSHCNLEIRAEKKIVIDACSNRSGSTMPPRAIQACTELLDRNIIDRHERFLVFANRAAAYVAQGDMQHALDDYNSAVKFAPHKAYLPLLQPWGRLRSAI